MAEWGVGLTYKPLATSEEQDECPSDGDELLAFLTRPNGPHTFVDLKQAYDKATAEEVTSPLPFVPREERFQNGLVWPLRSAKVALVTGQYVTCIAVSGMVAEMVAVLTYEMGDDSRYHHLTDMKAQVRVFGRTFEELGQERRIDILRQFEMLPGTMLDALGRIRGTRRRYLHFLDQDQTKLPIDAAACYRDALALVSFTVGQDLDKPRFTLNGNLRNYLIKHNRMWKLK